MSSRVVIVLVALLAYCSAAAAENWADRLGYPPGERVILIHAHGAGLSYETNAAVGAALESGAATCASALAPCPWFAHAVADLDGDLGLDLVVNSELPQYRWGPLAREQHTRSLVDADGYFWPRTQQTMVAADPVDVEYELRAQLQRARELGLKPTHFTTHMGALYSRPDLAEVYLRLAREQWIPAVVVELTQEQLDRFRDQGYPLPDSLIRIMADYPLPKLDDLRLCPRPDTYEAKKAALLDMIGSIEPGVTQIALAPAADSPALRAMTEGWRQHVWEAELLADADVRAALSAEGISLASWSDLMARFEGRAVEKEAMEEE